MEKSKFTPPRRQINLVKQRRDRLALEDSRRLQKIPFDDSELIALIKAKSQIEITNKEIADQLYRNDKLEDKSTTLDYLTKRNRSARTIQSSIRRALDQKSYNDDQRHISDKLEDKSTTLDYLTERNRSARTIQSSIRRALATANKTADASDQLPPRTVTHPLPLSQSKINNDLQIQQIVDRAFSKFEPPSTAPLPPRPAPAKITGTMEEMLAKVAEVRAAQLARARGYKTMPVARETQLTTGGPLDATDDRDRRERFKPFSSARQDANKIIAKERVPKTFGPSYSEKDPTTHDKQGFALPLPKQSFHDFGRETLDKHKKQ